MIDGIAASNSTVPSGRCFHRRAHFGEEDGNSEAHRHANQQRDGRRRDSSQSGATPPNRFAGVPRARDKERRTGFVTVSAGAGKQRGARMASRVISTSNAKHCVIAANSRSCSANEWFVCWVSSVDIFRIGCLSRRVLSTR